MPLAEHSDSYLRGELTVPTQHYGHGKSHAVGLLHSLSDVGFFHVPRNNLDELKAPQESVSRPRPRMPASLFPVPLGSAKPTVRRAGEPIRRILSAGRLFGGELNQMTGWAVFAVLDRPSATVFAKPSEETKFQVTKDAQNRLSGHERLFHMMILITRQEAAARHVPLRKIEALRAWSHEYEDADGVVIHVEVHGSDEERFSVWEGISERINLLYDNLNSQEREFLMNEVSVIVDRQ